MKVLTGVLAVASLVLLVGCQPPEPEGRVGGSTTTPAATTTGSTEPTTGTTGAAITTGSTTGTPAEPAKTGG